MSAIGRAEGGGRSTSQRSGPDVVLAGVAVLSIFGAILAGMIAGQAPILAVAAASALFLGTAIVLRPDVATLTTIAILYSNAAVVAVRFHDVPVFVAAIVPMLLAVPLARDLVVRRLPVVAPPMLGWMVALLFIHLVSALFSVDKTTAWDSVTVFLVEGFGLYFLLINVIRTPEMLRSVTWILLAAGAFVSLLSVHQDLTSNYGNDYFGFAQTSDAAFSTGVTTLTGTVVQPRLAGSIGETNRFAQVMLMLVPLGIFRFMSEPSRWLRILAGVMTTVITLGVVLTFSRGAAVGLGLLLIALVALRMVQRQHIVAIGLALVLVFVSFPQYWTRVSSLAAVGSLAGGGGTGAVDNSLLSRATETLSAALVMVDHPLIGVGPGLFPTYYEEYAQIVGIRIKNDATREAHNLYLGIGAELGVTGLVVFLIIAFLTVRMILIARRRSIDRRPDLERLTTPFALSILTYHVTGMFLHLSFARFYWLMLAVAGAAAVITLREMDATDTADATAPRSQGAYSQSV
ncbi:MAG: O-antigen ligase family protein [Candidatus Limnocylindrales bacterium]